MSNVLKCIEITDEVRPAFASKPAVVRAHVWKDLADLGEAVQIAERRAVSLVEEAMAEAARIHDEAHELGKAQGLALFLEAMSRQQNDHAVWLERAEPEAVELALKISERVIGDVIAVNPSAMAAMARTAALAAQGRGDFEMSVHPDAVVLMQEVVQRVAAEMGVRIRLKPDPRLTLVDCIVHTGAGDIDARLESQLNAIRQVLLGNS